MNPMELLLLHLLEVLLFIYFIKLLTVFQLCLLDHQVEEEDPYQPLAELQVDGVLPMIF